jgi:hypothetical protein
MNSHEKGLQRVKEIMKKLLFSFHFIYALSLVGMEPEKLTYLKALLKNPNPTEYKFEEKKSQNLLANQPNIDSKPNTTMLGLERINKTSKNKEQNLDDKQPKKLLYKNAPSIKPPSKKTNPPLQKIPNPQQNTGFEKSKEKNINLDTLKPKLVFRDLPCDFDDIP